MSSNFGEEYSAANPEKLPVEHAARRLSPALVTIIREGPGLGDLVTLLGAIQTLRTLHPRTSIQVRANQALADAVFRNHPDVTVYGAGIFPSGLVFQLSEPCAAEKFEARYHRSPHLSRIEIFARCLGIPEGVRVRVPAIFVSEAERSFARSWFLSKGLDTSPVCLVWRTSGSWKDYAHVAALHDLLRLAYDVFVLEHSLDTPGINTRGLSLREEVALIAQSRLVVTPDTGWLHVAGALGRPIFGLFGSQDPHIRQAPYGVPGQWLSGYCRRGVQPCGRGVCCDPSQSPPCLRFPPEAVDKLIRAFLETL